MEALLALLLFSGFAVVVGSYWQHILGSQKKAAARLQILSCATDLIDELLFTKNEAKVLANLNNQIMVKIEHMAIIQPRVIKGALQNLDNAQLLCAQITSKSDQIRLLTIIPEHI